MNSTVSRHKRALELLLAGMLCQFYGAGLLAEETDQPETEIQAVEEEELNHSSLNESPAFSPVKAQEQTILATNGSVPVELETIQQQAGMCLVIEGLIGDFCAQYPEDSGCLAIQQLNSQ